MSTEAKPCPFCGGSDIGVFEGGTFRWMSAECRDCGAQTSEVRVQTSGSGNRDEWKADAQARAIEEWNKRAEAAQPASPAPLTKAAIDEIVYACRQSGKDTTYDIINTVIAALASPQVAPAPKPLGPVWYMRDNHTFRALTGGPEEMVDQCLEEFDAGYTCGMLCSKERGIEVHASGKPRRDAFRLAALAALAAPVQVAPAGFKLVPIEPTIGMLQSALEASRAAGYSTVPMCHEMHWAGLCWSAMLGNPDASAASVPTPAAADDARDAARPMAKINRYCRANMCTESDKEHELDCWRLSTPAAKPAEEQGS